MRAAKTTPLLSDGYQLIDGYLGPEACGDLLMEIDEHRRSNGASEISRPMKGRSLRYSVIDGEEIQTGLPAIWHLYQEGMAAVVSELAGFFLAPLPNVRAAVNVNIMPPGRSEYRWHYDRAAVTAILYLNEVEGGETELYPNYRILLSGKHRPRAQYALDRLLHLGPVRRAFGQRRVVAPKAGRLVAMRGNRCWHSVRGVEGKVERINVIFAYDRPGAQFAIEDGLDSYLYSPEDAGGDARDPNYFP